MNYKPESSSADETKKREYLKQQHQLRTMTKSAAPLSADNMIETLLSKKEIFQKKTNQPEIASQKPQIGPWPVWLTPGREPLLYKEIWARVGLPNGLADTNKLSLLLMTSRLTTETLGYIWSLSNVTVPGLLTQQELYISLALVALAQNGYTFTNSNVVKQLKEAPQPVLDVHNFEAPIIQPLTVPVAPSFMAVHPPAPNVPIGPMIPVTSELHPLPPSVPTITENISLLDISHEPLSLMDSSPTKALAVLSATNLKNDFPVGKPVEPDLIFSDFHSNTGADDDFDDFKSADIFTSDMNLLTVLDVPAQKVTPEKDSSESNEKIDDLFPRCTVKPKSPELLPPLSALDEGKPRQGYSEPNWKKDCLMIQAASTELPSLEENSLASSLHPKKLFDPVLNITFDIKVDATESSLSDLKLEEQLPQEPLSLDLNPISQTSSHSPPASLPSVPLPLPAKGPPSLIPSSELTPQEDKYSALRLLDSGLFSTETNLVHNSDEFGDFLTADTPNSTAKFQILKDTDEDIQIKCLEACLKLLREAVSIFDNIEDSKILNEVIINERGKAYLQEILEVERIGRRIRSTRETNDLITEFENLSKILQPYIEYVKNNHLEEHDGPKCGICLCEHGPAHVKYGINHFHAPCANLYLHMVDPILPIAPVM